MRRILSLWLPYWATDRRCRKPKPSAPDATIAAAPLALTRAAEGAERLAHVNPAAAALGLRPGMTLADARALLPDLATAPASPEADARALRRLADWCGRYSPWVALDGADGIRLDVTGASHLFGGERALLADLEARLAGFGLTARLAIADGLGAAWGLARFAPTARTVAEAPARKVLAALPVAALRLASETVDGLAALGLSHIGQLLAIPPAELARRFGRALPERLAQALGQAAEPISPARPVPWFLVRLNFPEPIAAMADISAAVERLAAELCASLQAEQKGARRLELTLYLADGGVRRLAVGCSRPSRAPGHLARLFREKLSGLEAGFGADVATLAATVVEPLGAAQLGLDRAAAVPADDDGLGALLDRLGNRLGLGNVVRLAPRRSHLPERAVRVVAPLEPSGGGPWGPELPRPVSLLPAPELVEAVAEVPDGPPVLFRWRGVTHRVARADGPERIAPEWWRAEGRGRRVRDYYRLEDGEGARFWVYRDGLYGPGESPRWYLHGLFA
jgi:protein ImuB